MVIRRLERPCVYSWKTTDASSAASPDGMFGCSARGPEEVQRHPPRVPVGRGVHRRVVDADAAGRRRARFGAHEGLGPDRVSTLTAEPVVVHRLEVAGRLREPDGRLLEVVVIGVEQVVGLDRFLAAVESPAVRVVGVPGARGRGPAVLRWRRGVEDAGLSQSRVRASSAGISSRGSDRVVAGVAVKTCALLPERASGPATGNVTGPCTPPPPAGAGKGRAARRARSPAGRPSRGSRATAPVRYGIDHGAVDARGRDGRDRGPGERVAPGVGKQHEVARSRGPGIGAGARAATPAEAWVASIASVAVSAGRVRAGSRTTW